VKIFLVASKITSISAFFSFKPDFYVAQMRNTPEWGKVWLRTMGLFKVCKISSRFLEIFIDRLLLGLDPVSCFFLFGHAYSSMIVF